MGMKEVPMYPSVRRVRRAVNVPPLAALRMLSK